MQRRVSEQEEAEQQARRLLQEREADLQQSEQRHREETAQLEGALADAKSQIREVTLRASLAEGKAQGLEEQLSQGDAMRRDLEHKLLGLCSALRRTLGIGLTGVSRTPGSRRRTPSHWGTPLPVKGMTVHFEVCVECIIPRIIFL